MDIKSFILIGGGILIAAVIGHGFWLAWRSRREPYRLDIVPDLIPDDVDDMERLRGELPNGGARKVAKPQQTDLDLDEPAPLLLEPLEGPPAPEPQAEEPVVAKVKVRDVQLPDEPIRATDAPIRANPEDPTPALGEARAKVQRGNRKTQTRESRETRAAREAKEAREARESEARQPAAPRSAEATPEPAVEELLVIRVISNEGRFYGPELFDTLRTLGLKYGDMNIFHKQHPLSKTTLYSVANAVEPGTFDLSDIDAFSTRGLTFFLQLPGPEDPTAVLDDMLGTTTAIAERLGGTLKDEHMSVLTAQTVEHYRQRIADFARRRLSMRA